MSILWEVVKDNYPGRDKYDLLVEFDTVLGLDLINAVSKYESSHENIPSGVAQLIELRQQARDQKDFAKADTLRAEIAKFGWLVEDTNLGQKVKKSK
jgi:cysteinyl-tRNA synthetase